MKTLQSSYKIKVLVSGKNIRLYQFSELVFLGVKFWMSCDVMHFWEFHNQFLHISQCANLTFSKDPIVIFRIIFNIACICTLKIIAVPKSGVHVLLVSLFGIPIVRSISHFFGWPKKIWYTKRDWPKVHGHRSSIIQTSHLLLDIFAISSFAIIEEMASGSLNSHSFLCKLTEGD